MAQERRRVRRRWRLAGRYGAVCGVGAALALCMALAGVTALGALGEAPVQIERAHEQGLDGGVPGQLEGDGDARGEKDTVAEKDGDAAGDTAEPAQTAIVVHVDGAVAAPGVYALAAGSRANDAVSAAGGLLEGADTSGLNLAAPLADGEKLYVPVEGEAPAGGAPTGGGGAGEAQGGLVNLNTAGLEELDELPGVGEATARAIIEDREANGPFSSPEDIMRVSGIGEKKFERLEGLICV